MSAQQFENQQTFVDLLDLLEGKYVVQPGTRDKDGNTLFILNDLESKSNCNCEPQSVLAVLNYLVSSWVRYSQYARDDESGSSGRTEVRIALLIDRRNASWQQVEALVSTINHLVDNSREETTVQSNSASENLTNTSVNWRSVLKRIYVLKSVGFTSLFSVSNAQKTVAKQSRVPLVFVNFVTQLHAYISQDALPVGSPFNGSCSYDHDSWLKQRNAVESYLAVANNFERKAAALIQRWRAERRRIQLTTGVLSSDSNQADQAPLNRDAETGEKQDEANTSTDDSVTCDCSCTYQTLAECLQVLAEEEKRAYAKLLGIELFLEDVDSLIDHCATPNHADSDGNTPHDATASDQGDLDLDNENEKENENGTSSNASTLKDGTLRQCIDAGGSLHIRVLERIRRRLANVYARYRRAWNVQHSALRRVLEFRRFEERAAHIERELETRMINEIETAHRQALETLSLEDLESILRHLIALQTNESHHEYLERLSELVLFAIDRESTSTSAAEDAIDTETAARIETASVITEDEPLSDITFDWTAQLGRLRQVGYRLRTLLEQCESCLRVKQRILTAVVQLESWCERCGALLEALAQAQGGQESNLVSESDTQQIAAFAAEYDTLVAALNTETTSLSVTDESNEGGKVLQDVSLTPQLISRVQQLMQDATGRLDQLRASQQRLENAARQREEAQRLAELAAQSQLVPEEHEPAGSALSEVIAATLKRKTTRRNSDDLLRRPTDDIVIGIPKLASDSDRSRRGSDDRTIQPPQTNGMNITVNVSVADAELTSADAAFENGFSTLKRLREIQQLELAVASDDNLCDSGTSTFSQTQSQLLPAAAGNTANASGSTGNSYASGTLRSVAGGLRHSPSVAVKDKHFLRCRYVVNELIETERAYVADLETVLRGYAEAWRSEPALEKLLPAAFRSDPDSHFATLFGNMPAILSFHKQRVLVHLLNATQSSTLMRGADCEQNAINETELCDIFIDNESVFVELYAAYCQGRSAADRLLRAANRGELDEHSSCACCERDKAAAEPVSRIERKTSTAKRPDEAAEIAARADSLKRAADAGNTAASSASTAPCRSNECKCQSTSTGPPSPLSSPVADSVHEHAYFRECRKRLRHRLPLDAYLLKPTQRITKYQLLLTDLLRSMKSFQAASLSSPGAEVDDAARAARLARFCGHVERVEQAQRTMLRVLASINNAMHEAMIVACPKRNLAAFGPLLLQATCTVLYKLSPPRSSVAVNQERDRGSVFEAITPMAQAQADPPEVPDGPVDMRPKRLTSSTSAQTLSAFSAAPGNPNANGSVVVGVGVGVGTNAISASLKQHYYAQRTHHRHLFLYERCILFTKPMNVDDNQSEAHDSSFDGHVPSTISSSGNSRSSMFRGDALNGSIRAQTTCVGLPIGSRQVRYRIKHILELNRIGLTESLPGNPRRFELWTPREREKYIIEMKKTDEKTTWTEAIKTLLFKQLQEIKQRRSSVAIGVHYIDLHVGSGVSEQLHTVNSSTLHVSSNSSSFKFAHPESPDGSSSKHSVARHARRSSLGMLREQVPPNPVTADSNVPPTRQSSKTGLKVAGKVFKKQIAKIGQKLGSSSAAKKSAVRMSLSGQFSSGTGSVANQPLAELPGRYEPESTTESEFEAESGVQSASARSVLNQSLRSADGEFSAATGASVNYVASSASSASANSNSNRSPSVKQSGAKPVATTTAANADRCSTSSLTEVDPLSLLSGRSIERSDDLNSVSTRSVGSADSTAWSANAQPRPSDADVEVDGDSVPGSPVAVARPTRVSDDVTLSGAVDSTCIGTPSLVRFDAATLRRAKPTALFVALSDYIAVTERELTAYEGEFLQAVKKRTPTPRTPDRSSCEPATDSDREDDDPIYTEPAFIYVRKLATDEFGYVPASYLTRHEPLADTALNESIL